MRVLAIVVVFLSCWMLLHVLGLLDWFDALDASVAAKINSWEAIAAGEATSRAIRLFIGSPSTWLTAALISLGVLVWRRGRFWSLTGFPDSAKASTLHPRQAKRARRL